MEIPFYGIFETNIDNKQEQHMTVAMMMEKIEIDLKCFLAF